MTDTPTSFTVRDGNGITRTFVVDADVGGNMIPHHLLRSDGVEVGAGHPLPVSAIQAGTTGTDYSVNAAAIPVAGYVLLLTIPATATRAMVEVQNQSAATLQLVRDDGTGLNQTSILLASGGGAGSQGAGWSSATFKGRVRVYGAAGAQVAAYQE